MGIAKQDRVGRTFWLPAGPPCPPEGRVVVITAGTSDLPVAQEAVTTARVMGCDVSLLADVLAVIRADEEKVWSETIVDRLAELRPDVYGSWSGQKAAAKATQLAAALKAYGTKGWR